MESLLEECLPSKGNTESERRQQLMISFLSAIEKDILIRLRRFSCSEKEKVMKYVKTLERQNNKNKNLR